MMKARVQRWGNDLAIRIPDAVVEEMAMSENTDIEIHLIEGAIVLQPPPKTGLSLEELIEKITLENHHAEIDWGKPVGKEIIS